MSRKPILLGAAGVAVVAALVAYLWALGRPKPLVGYGTIEARNIRVGSKVGGRIEKVLTREGDFVEPGQVLVTFEEDELKAALENARANLAKLERGFRPEEIEEARAAAAQARAGLEKALTGYRHEEVAQAKADVDRARADAENAERSWKRANRLAEEGVWSRQQRDDAEAAWKMAAAQLENAEQRLTELDRGYRAEDVAAAEAAYRQAEATRQLRERGYRAEDVAMARAAFLDAATKYRERQVAAPAAATVEVLDVRPGDLIPPNTSVATLLERDQLYIRIYIPETQIGRVQVGQRAEVRVDSFPGESFAGEVEQVNQQAEFLPRNVQTPDERVHQVFGVKLRLYDPSGRLRAGMAADVKLLEE
jgi:multidrug resistance efflux pump